MNIYVYDRAWKGAIILVAESREEASEKVQQSVTPEEWTVEPLDSIIYTEGDC